MQRGHSKLWPLSHLNRALCRECTKCVKPWRLRVFAVKGYSTPIWKISGLASVIFPVATSTSTLVSLPSAPLMSNS